MRTIKASEVRKGMRVRVEESVGGSTITTEGPVLSVDVCNSEFTELIFDGTLLGVDPDHPVTVLAEPGPEWVEGAWYWVELTSEPRRPLKRLAGGWTCYDDDRAWFSDDSYPDITVLGRVPIVDWPGDEHASELVKTYGAGLTWDDFECSPLQKVADAIRTQGGAR